MLFSKVPWDTELFGVDVYSLESWLISEGAQGIGTEDWFAATLKALGRKRAMLTARIPSNEDALRIALTRLNMAIIEWTLHPVLELEDYDAPASSRVKMRPASEGDLLWLSTQARDAFKISRYFRDPLVPVDLAAARFEAWIESALMSLSKEVFVFENSDLQPIGFFVVSMSGGLAQLELTAISENMRGRGWSLPVWRAYLHHAKKSGLKSVATNISAENSAVVGIYPKLGFRFGQSSVAMHGHYF